MRLGPGEGLDPSAARPSHPAPPPAAIHEAGSPGATAAPVPISPGAPSSSLGTARAASSPRHSPLVATALAAASDNAQWIQDLPEAPVFTPTAEQWADPIAYIESIAADASKFGGAVIRAPLAPAIPAAALLKDLRFATRLQSLRDVPWGDSWEEGAKFWETGRQNSLSEFSKNADEFARRRLGLAVALPPGTAEALYWKERAAKGSACVEYGSDVEGSGFGDGGAGGLDASAWNLKTLPRAPGSALRWATNTLPGVATPMLYIAQLYSTFAWHVEDHFLLAANYNHAGAPKIWYCVPAAGAEALEAAAAATVYRDAVEAMERGGASPEERAAAVAAALARKTTMISPEVLRAHGVPVFRAVQHPGSFIITFPRCYHAGFSTGFSIAEAVNLSTPGWWPVGEMARRLYRSVRPPRAQVLSHSQLLCDEARALGRRLWGGEGAGAVNGAERPRLGADWPIAAAFVAEMQAAQAARDDAWSAGAAAVAACPPSLPPDAPEMRAAVPCPECGDLSFLASVVLDGAAPQDGWRHLCLHCAAADGASACTRRTLMFVKPCWRELVGLAARFQPLVEAEAREGAPAVVAAAAAGGVFPPVIPSFQWCNFEEPATELPAWALGRAPPPPAERLQKPSPEPEPAPLPLPPPLPVPAVQEAPTAEEEEKTMEVDEMVADMGGGGEEMERNGQEGGEDGGDQGAGAAEVAAAVAAEEAQAEEDAAADEPNCHVAEQAAVPVQQETGPLARTRGKRVRLPPARAGSPSPAPRVRTSAPSPHQTADDSGDSDGGGPAPRYTAASSAKADTSIQPARFLFHDALSVPGKEEPTPRRVIQIISTGERVILGGDVVRACVPSWEKNLSLTRWLTRKLRGAAGALRGPGSADDSGRHLAFVPFDKQERAVTLRESGARLLLEGTARRGDSLHEIYAAMFAGVWDGEAGGAADGSADGEDGEGQRKRQRVSEGPPPTATTVDDLPAFLRAISPLAAAEALCASLQLRTPANPDSHPILPEAPGSVEGLKRYVLPETGEVAVSAYHVITPVIKGSFACAQVLSSWTRSVARSPQCTAAHVVAMAPLFYRCEGFKSHTGATFLLTLEQCAIVGAYSLNTKKTPPEGRATLRTLMVQAWGEEAVAAADAAVKAEGFQPKTPLREEVRRALEAALREETCGRKLPPTTVRQRNRKPKGRGQTEVPAVKAARGRGRGRGKARRSPTPDEEEEEEEDAEMEAQQAGRRAVSVGIDPDAVFAPMHEIDEAEARFAAMLAAVHSKNLPTVPDHIAAALEQLSSEPVLKLDDGLPTVPAAAAAPQQRAGAAQAYGQQAYQGGYAQHGPGAGAFQMPLPTAAAAAAAAAAAPAGDPISALLAALQTSAQGNGAGWGGGGPMPPPGGPAAPPRAPTPDPALAAMQSMLNGFAAAQQQQQQQQPMTGPSQAQDAINQQIMSLLWGAGGAAAGAPPGAGPGPGGLPGQQQQQQQFWR